MLNNKLKKLVTVTLFSALFGMLSFAFVADLALAQQRADIGFNYARNVGLAESNEEDIRDTAVDIIRYLLTFLSIIAVVIILYGGFVWMTAAGNEDRVGKAKKIIISGVIGLAVILAAFAIVTFVVDITYKALNGF